MARPGSTVVSDPASPSLAPSFFALKVPLSPAGCSEPALPGGGCCVPPPSCEERSSAGPGAGLSLRWGGARGPVCRGRISLPSPQQPALASLFTCIFITSGLVSDTLSYSCAHLAPHLDTLTNGLSECLWRGKPVFLGVKFEMTAWGGGH